ncbi:holin [Micromonospora sp. HUAS LYJ1]|uniref:holin n=1 Tax=Micromonospora sp. HUAS LYJ1 TaxID=3061626 RepID=UPI002670E879|nr:holin [Micromonospora sp. HUAS LYJ1]WKU03764.1 holin [Micromonospora sp. HUAS LYJ1]
MFTGRFWKAAAERAGKSAAQALLGLWALDAGFNVLHADFPLAGGVAAGAAVLSLLTSVVSAGAGEPDSPSLVTNER